MQKAHILYFLLTLFCAQVFAKVDPPNYNFSLDSLQPFYPGQPLDAIQKKYGKGELIDGKSPAKLYKFYVAQIRYKFPVYVHIFEGKSVEFYARLPQYFLHDVFHQSLINRMGKQNDYKKKENAAVYIWRNFQGSKFTYGGSCTITCFPMYLTGRLNDMPAGLGRFQGLMDKLSIQNFTTEKD